MSRFWILGIVLLALPFCVGCPTSTPTDSPESKAAAPEPDDPEAVAALEKLGGKLTKDGNGNVIRADFSAVVPEDVSEFEPISKLKQLQLIKFYGAEITDQVTTYMKDLTELRDVDFTNGVITDAGVENLTNSKNLSAFGLRRTNISNKSLEIIANNFPKARYLDFRYCNVDDEGMKSVGQMKNMEVLRTEGAFISDEGMAHLADLTKMRFLNLRDKKITDKGIAYLSGMKNLETLELNEVACSNEGLSHIQECVKLKKLHLFRTKVTDDGMQYLTEMKDMEDLKFRQSPVRGEQMEQLKGMTKLKRLDVSETPFVDDGVAVVATFENLELLNLWNTFITDDGLAPVSNLKKLKDLDLQNCALSDAGVKHLEGMTSLTSLSLKENSSISDESIPVLNTLTNLKKLTLNFTQIYDDGVEQLKKANPKLEVSF
ncbi:leucine-rich repeat domain-containing protein [Bremerella alba]|uniref:F-box/LRR-repeat protein 15-like leucin rich repeat domain-containing protein n=1 Tax=Bremerella alba TaxID=980252 RepID=A0A7V9A9Y2_9BACT|nr:hypothetical protein [Bremerella alba]MBA2117922.1 hypothetical protein [Bremerella alba]